MKKKALLIGLNYPNTNNELRGCHNDVDRLAHLLVRQKFDEIRVIKDGEGEARTSREDILLAMQLFAQSDEENTQYFFHFSGHGTQTADTNQDEKDFRDEAIVAGDMQLILDDEIRSHLIDRAKGDIFILLDCCNSGTGGDLRYTCKDVNGRKIRRQRYSSRTANPAISISGCLDHQTSADALIDNSFAGAMTTSFLIAWERARIHRRYGDLHYIFQLMREYLRENKFSQRPMISFGRPKEASRFQRTSLILFL